MTLWQKINTPLDRLQVDIALLYIIGIGLGGMVFIIGVVGVIYMQYFYASAATTEGIVTGHIEDGDLPAGQNSIRQFSRNIDKDLSNPRFLAEKLVASFENKPFFTPQIGFSVNATEYGLRAGSVSTIYINERWPLNMRVTVYYEPQNPKVARLRNYDYEWAEPLRYLIPGMIALAIVPRAISGLKKREKKK